NQKLVAAQQLRKRAELAILALASASVEQEHPRSVAFGRRPLRDPLGRQLVIEIAEIHWFTAPNARFGANNIWHEAFNCAKRASPPGEPLPTGSHRNACSITSIMAFREQALVIVANHPAGLFARRWNVAEGSVVISPRGVERLRAGHLWIYRSDVRSAEAEAGAIVRLTDERGRFHGRAFYSDKSQIAIRLITPHDVPVDRAFFTQRFQRAAEFRKRIVENTEAYRLVYSEADLLSSLIVDRYADYLVIQTLSQGTERQKDLFVQILVELFSPKGILERNDPRVRLLEALDQRVGVLYGEIPPEIQAKENGISFIYDLQKGQKTGAFLDQRENHWAARRYASGEVLDCFSYQGGFALTVAGNCERVEAIDMAPAAVEAAKRNQALNSISNVNFQEGNTFDMLKEYDDAGRR